MKKIFSLFLGLLLLLIPLHQPEVVQAATCSISTTPSPVTTNEKNINVEITSNGLVEGNRYWIWLNNYPEPVKTSTGTIAEFTFSSGRISIQNLNGYNSIRSSNATFQPQTYSLSVREPRSGGENFCTVFFEVQGTKSGGSCEIIFENDSFETTKDIKIHVTNLGGNPPDGRRVVLKRDRENGREVKAVNTTVAELSSSLNVGKVETGAYYIEVRSGQDPLASRICFKSFIVGAEGEEQGEIPTSPCQGPTKNNFLCNTALGEISSDPEEFIKRVFGILLSLAGGIALLLIIASGYRLMTSQGNPEKVQAAREQLTSAIVGLLFIIFSLSILTIIGVDILRIPGFGAETR